MADIHTCSYYCTRPECIKTQRDELRDRLEAQQQAEPVAWFHDDYGAIELSRIRRVGWRPLYASHPPRITAEQVKKIKRLASLLETQVRSVYLLGDNAAERKEMVADVLETRAALHAALDALRSA